MSAIDIDRRVRALAERVGCWLTLRGSEVKVFRGHVDAGADDGLAVATINGTYVVDELQAPGGRRMSAASWARGRH